MDLSTALPVDAYHYGNRTSGGTHGVVLTKPHVVELILDLADYSSDRDLADRRLLEPSCGKGAFLLPAVQRLLISAKRCARDPASLFNAITAFDVDPEHVAVSRRDVAALLSSHGVVPASARALAEAWIRQGDFLLAALPPTFDAVVGNPPYIRIEHLAPRLQGEYRHRYKSLFDRADIYVAFIERGLELLNTGGILSYVCADRWVLNKYGAPLRQLIAEHYRVKYFIDLHRASPFDTSVVAYPSIFAITPGTSRSVMVGSMTSASEDECANLRASHAERQESPGLGPFQIYREWFKGDSPWVITSPIHLDTLRQLEARFEPLESSGTTIGIGVATGSDKVFIVDEGVDIEPDRLVPLVMRRDIQNGELRNAQRFVINTFRDEGGLIELQDYPRLSRYFESRQSLIRVRHVSKKNPRAWFRTIDRVYPALVKRPKLLIPDIAGSNEVTFDEGKYHPHHNLYFVTSDTWDMEVLGGLLSSRVALFFIWSYAVKMRGGYLRFQAQYLRRIRVPHSEALNAELKDSIRVAFRERDFASLDKLALEAYELAQLPDFDFVDTRK